MKKVILGLGILSLISCKKNIGEVLVENKDSVYNSFLLQNYSMCNYPHSNVVLAKFLWDVESSEYVNIPSNMVWQPKSIFPLSSLNDYFRGFVNYDNEMKGKQLRQFYKKFDIRSNYFDEDGSAKYSIKNISYINKKILGCDFLNSDERRYFSFRDSLLSNCDTILMYEQNWFMQIFASDENLSGNQSKFNILLEKEKKIRSQKMINLANNFIRLYDSVVYYERFVPTKIYTNNYNPNISYIKSRISLGMVPY